MSDSHGTVHPVEFRSARVIAEQSKIAERDALFRTIFDQEVGPGFVGDLSAIVVGSHDGLLQASGVQHTTNEQITRVAVKLTSIQRLARYALRHESQRYKISDIVV